MLHLFRWTAGRRRPEKLVETLFFFYLTCRAAYRFSSIYLFPTRWYRPRRYYYSSSTLLDNWSTIKDETGWNQKSGRKTASKFWFPVAFRLLCRLSAVCPVSRWEPKMHLSPRWIIQQIRLLFFHDAMSPRTWKVLTCRPYIDKQHTAHCTVLTDDGRASDMLTLAYYFTMKGRQQQTFFLPVVIATFKIARAKCMRILIIYCACLFFFLFARSQHIPKQLMGTCVAADVTGFVHNNITTTTTNIHEKRNEKKNASPITHVYDWNLE